MDEGDIAEENEEKSADEEKERQMDYRQVP